MSIIDIALGLFILIMAVRGVVKGFVREVFGLTALILGIFSAYTFQRTLGMALQKHLTITTATGNIAAFFIIFFTVYIIILLIGITISSILKKIDLGFTDRVLGLTFGAFKAVLFIAIITMIFHNIVMFQSISQSMRKDSFIYYNIDRFTQNSKIIQNTTKTINKKRGLI